jgi:hypothetical protein
VSNAQTVNLRSREGAASLLSTLVCLPVVVLLIGFAAYFGRAYYAKFAVEEAALAGARFAQTSLGGGRACSQTLAAMRSVASGYAIDPEAAAFAVRPLGAATSRTRQIEIRVSYRVDQSIIPVFGALLGDTNARARYVATVDANISRQRYGWTRCKTALRVKG